MHLLLHRWTTTNMEEGPVFISHEILDNQTAVYEPFYVSPDDVPPYDERFLGYGFTRNSQVRIASYNKKNQFCACDF